MFCSYEQTQAGFERLESAQARGREGQRRTRLLGFDERHPWRLAFFVGRVTRQEPYNTV